MCRAVVTPATSPVRSSMKRVVQVKLVTGPAHQAALTTTLHTCNHAANYVSAQARQHKVYSKAKLQALTYHAIKEQYGLGAQAALHCLRKTASAYQTHWANLKAGNLGKPGSKRWRTALTTVLTFRADSAQPYDDRMLSWDHETRTVSVWVIDDGSGKPGRLRIPFVGHPQHLEDLEQYRQGESDLLMRGGEFFLVATLEIPTPHVQEPEGFIGVDLGIAQIASLANEQGTPLGEWSGGAVTLRRKKNVRLRSQLQAKGTKSAKRLLKKRSRKESRFTADVNHQISKSIVTEAQRTGRGIALEDLTGIRDRVRLRKPQRVALHSWAFAQLAQFITYKAHTRGVAVVFVDPAYTSQMCSRCGVVCKSNRVSQALYRCSSCGVSLNADTNAAINIARRGVRGWADVNQPYAA